MLSDLLKKIEDIHRQNICICNKYKHRTNCQTQWGNIALTQHHRSVHLYIWNDWVKLGWKGISKCTDKCYLPSTPFVIKSAFSWHSNAMTESVHGKKKDVYK